MFYSEGQATFQKATQTGIHCGTLKIVIQEVLWSIRGSCWAIWSNPLTNVKWHSDPWQTVTSLPIRLSTNFMTFIPSLTFTELWVVSMEHIQRAWLASRERLPFRTPGSVPNLGLANAPIVETTFLELAMSLLDFSPRIPLGTFSILHCIWSGYRMSFNITEMESSYCLIRSPYRP